MRRFGGRGFIAAAAALGFAVAASFAAAQDAERPDGLRQLWTDILTKAQAGDEAGVKAALEGMVLAEGDFAAIFKDEAKAKELAAKYAEKFAKHWPNEAKTIVSKVKERKYDEVEVNEVAADQATGNDKKVLELLKDGVKMYTVRLKKKGEKQGLRYDSFFHVSGAWKTGLKLGRLLGEPASAEKPGGDSK